MPAKELTVKILVDAETPTRLKDKENLLKAFANLSAEEQKIMTEIMTNAKAMKGLIDNYDLLKSMIDN